MRRIVCVGNRYVQDDAAGPRVYDRLDQLELPPDVEVVDGGLAGLGLLHLVADAERVVFVDATEGLPADRPVAVVDWRAVAATATPHCDHEAGLPYLLRVLPLVCAPMPEIALVGLAPSADDEAVTQAATLTLQLAGGAAP